MSSSGPDYSKEAERLRSFEPVFKIKTVSAACALAEEGCYYTDRKAKCLFCGQEDSFGQDDHHITKVPHQACDKSPNVVLTEAKKMTIVMALLKGSAYDACVAPSIGDYRKEMGCLPAQPGYENYDDRNKTYSVYPLTSPVSADKLCTAGFIYIGPGDNVKCYFCEGQLQDWKAGDIPANSHARFYPGCGFMMQFYGREFIIQQCSQMTLAEQNSADGLVYRKNDTSFLPNGPRPAI